MKESEARPRPFDGTAAQPAYVAFVEILGFGRRVLENFDEVLDVYQNVLDGPELINRISADVTLRVYSDAFVLSTAKLSRLIAAIQALHMQTLFFDCLVRGGIGYGSHVEASEGQNLYVVSQALVRAVQVERSVRFPCVALHESVEVPARWWDPRGHNLERGLLYFEGIRLVNPFNPMWGHSAMTRVAMMSADDPEYNEKYEWFLRLYEAVMSDHPLVPVGMDA